MRRTSQDCSGQLHWFCSRFHFSCFIFSLYGDVSLQSSALHHCRTTAAASFWSHTVSGLFFPWWPRNRQPPNFHYMCVHTGVCMKKMKKNLMRAGHGRKNDRITDSSYLLQGVENVYREFNMLRVNIWGCKFKVKKHDSCAHKCWCSIKSEPNLWALYGEGTRANLWNQGLKLLFQNWEVFPELKTQHAVQGLSFHDGSRFCHLKYSPSTCLFVARGCGSYGTCYFYSAWFNGLKHSFLKKVVVRIGLTLNCRWFYEKEPRGVH